MFSKGLSDWTCAWTCGFCSPFCVTFCVLSPTRPWDWVSIWSLKLWCRPCVMILRSQRGVQFDFWWFHEYVNCNPLFLLFHVLLKRVLRDEQKHSQLYDLHFWGVHSQSLRTRAQAAVESGGCSSSAWFLACSVL